MSSPAAPPYEHRPEDDSIQKIDHKQSPTNTIPPQQPRGTTGTVTVEGYVPDSQKQAHTRAYQFRWTSLWQPAVVNPINGKSYTLPLLRFWDPYASTFWLATLGESNEARQQRFHIRAHTSSSISCAQDSSLPSLAGSPPPPS